MTAASARPMPPAPSFADGRHGRLGETVAQFVYPFPAGQ